MKSAFAELVNSGNVAFAEGGVASVAVAQGPLFGVA